jgi:hypothetical protein
MSVNFWELTKMAILRQPSPGELHDLYWNKGLSTRALAREFGTYQGTVLRWMRKYNIPRRDRIQAVVKGCSKYVKTPFNGTLQDKAYLLGFSFADLGRRRHGYQVRVAACTTHPSFGNLFKTSFERFTHIYERPRFNKEKNKYEWELETFLHPSFGFLLSCKRTPRWVLQDNSVFMHFLAGYADGEGILSIARNTKRCVAFLFCISSEDKAILRSIYGRLKSMGFHPSLRKLREAGEINVFDGKISCYTKDFWMLRLKRRKEVIKLLEILPLKHSEKVRKKQLMFKLRAKVYQKDVEDDVLRLKNEIKSEVLKYKQAAEKAYRKRRSNPSGVPSPTPSPCRS